MEVLECAPLLQTTDRHRTTLFTRRTATSLHKPAPLSAQNRTSSLEQPLVTGLPVAAAAACVGAMARRKGRQRGQKSQPRPGSLTDVRGVYDVRPREAVASKVTPAAEAKWKLLCVFHGWPGASVRTCTALPAPARRQTARPACNRPTRYTYIQ